MMLQKETIRFNKKSGKLLWNDTEVYSTDIKDVIENSIPENIRYFLPGSVILLFDKEIVLEIIDNFIREVTDYLIIEFNHRETRKLRFIESGLLSTEEYKNIITQQKAIQPWILYYSNHGGLGDYNEGNNSVSTGMIPCASMKNHAVAWQNSDGNFKMWIVTSRRINEQWDWDSDFGHESGHACFAPIPLFVQSLHLQQDASRDLLSVNSIHDLTPGNIARICYMLTEIAVIAVRGERRETISGLPVAENPEEFRAFLNLSDQLMPGLGFRDALNKYDESAPRFVGVNEGDLIFYIGAACLKGLSSIKENFRFLTVPSVNMFPSQVNN